ncbi:MAG TPA: LytTR family DNA-binding domain-containing protein [Pyrinomonadaceae bacterium]|jgi:two-component system LytT family response regulator|nr:LytTR family DNA-binding domain-containing protein [Pyrinomonadaceae bacterium]
MTTEPKKFKALIVDDEPLARRTIKALLEDDSSMQIIGECGSGPEAVNFIREQPPDILFLDIQMPGMNGFEVLASIDHDKIPAVVFVTAFDQYALKAFEVHALDYLLKPFTDQRFKETLRQAKTNVEMKEMNRLSKSLMALLKEHAGLQTDTRKRKSYLSRFMIKLGGRVVFINAAEVDWIAADNYYIKLHVGGKSHLLRISMNELEEKLDPEKFLRIHRSTIINFDRVKELHQNPNGEYVVVLKNGTELKLSRSRRERLMELLMHNHD